eukprot:TRINITY_DN47297_c0_g1_i1.p1 TRINITY_DN47297_c0_g1~~TRINITY_DN47297_c0_g1_i1.p1  ORF type:complete len:206 (+),score=56.59 TRINITY_DN47297_c0_g1_i1:93-710(+)
MKNQGHLATNVLLTTVVVLYLFGGDKPLVSQVTAVAAGTTQLIVLLTTLVVTPVLKKAGLGGGAKVGKEDTTEEPVPSLLEKTRENLTRVVFSQDFYCCSGVVLAFATARFCRAYGILTSAFQVIPVSLLGGALTACIAQRFCADDESCAKEDADHDAFDAADDPYNADFWSDLDGDIKASSSSSDEHVSLQDITSEMYLKTVLK